MERTNFEADASQLCFSRPSLLDVKAPDNWSGIRDLGQRLSMGLAAGAAKLASQHRSQLASRAVNG